MTEPKAELNAILESKENLGFYPLTIFRYALLDAISSPFLNTTKNLNLMSVLPTWFVMTQEVESLVKYGSDVKKIEEAAYKEADKSANNSQDIVDFTRNFIKHLYGINVLEPEDSSTTSEGQKGKKAQTAS